MLAFAGARAEGSEDGGAPALGPAAGLSVRRLEEPPVERSLSSPYRGERRRAVEAVLGEESPRGRARELLRSADPALRAAGADVLQRLADPPEAAEVLDALLSERDPAVRRRLARLFAERCAAELDALHAALEQGPLDGPTLDRIVGERVRAVLEDRMSDGRVPGFYDGQFSELWPYAADMERRLLSMGSDDSLHYVLRALAVMALHEAPKEEMERDFEHLLLSEEEEFAIARNSWFQPRPMAWEIVIRRRADLSRYARFALAKAGHPEAVLRMIRRMDEEIEGGRRLMDSRIPSQDQDFLTTEEFLREWLLGLLFETGYYFQQFDDYASAEARYLQLVQRYPDASACQNAYYNLACIAAIQERRGRAIEYLRKAVERGFTDHEWLLEDRDLSSLWGRPEFEDLVQLARTGQVPDDGGEWMQKLIPLLPAGQAFLTLSLAEKERVLRKVGDGWTAAERDQLLKALSDEERSAVERLWRELGVGE